MEGADSIYSTKELADLLSSIEDFTAQNIEESFKSFLAEKELGFGVVLPNFRLSSNGLRDGSFYVSNFCFVRQRRGA